MKCIARLALLALASIAATATAQPLGSAFTYQGRLTESGQPATGLYDVQVCLFDSAVNPVAIGCAPDFNDIPVEAGVFTIALNFGAAPFAGQQRFLELHVRPGASTGGYTILVPRQLVRPAPEALRANVASAAPWSGLTGVPAGFADGIDNDSGGTVTSVTAGTGLSGGTIVGAGTIGIAPGGVGAAQIATGGVGSAQLADGSIAAIDLASNAVGAAALADNAADTAAVQNLAITQAKIAAAAVGTVQLAAGAVGLTQINTAQVQARVSGTCGDGEYFRGINADGSLACELLPVAANRVLDLVGDVGTHVALVLRADQRPLVAYHDETNGNLKVYDCADPACASGTRRVLDASGDVGVNIAMAIGPSGLPVIAYRNVASASLRFYACANAACSSGIARTLDSGVTVGAAVAMALRADGRPLVAYYDGSFFRLRVYECDNLDCSSGAAHAHPGTAPPYGVAIALRGDGRALIALGGNAGAGVRARVYDCTDTGCTTGTVRTLTDASFSQSVAIAIRSNGRALVAASGLAATLGVYDCANAECSTGTFVYFEPGVSAALAMALRANGRALIAFSRGSAVTNPRVFDCGNAGCSAGSSRGLVAGENFGAYVALALRDDGRPVIAYYDEDNGDLRMHLCANPDCS